ncbi:MAG: hypothetical protein KGI29_02795 [Pseudomonadota bacterium]|nr:hypothetical protein [Pseudomonadota bacterium]MDE3037821.1 hypothetical protein [Pseudomonadota bacterium]
MPRQKPLRRYGENAALAHQLAGTRQAFDEFATIVAHDLGAPLRSIAGFSQLLEEKCRLLLDEKTLRYIDVISENSRKLQARLAGLLQYSRLGTVPLMLKAVDCQTAARHCLEQLKDKIEEREALLRVGPLPQVTGDGDRLGLLLYALCDNALKFCARRPEVDIMARRSLKAWVFSVRDNGIGIAPKHHQVIFDVFRRLHPEEAYSGTGMGLALAHRIAALHGGMIWVESREGMGATFLFTIPDAAANTGTA